MKKIHNLLRKRLQELRTPAAAPRPVGRGQRGFTLLEILIVLAILGLIMGLLIGPQIQSMFGESQERLAQAEVKKYAFEAYTRWSMSSPGKACPADLTELAKYLNKDNIKDPWGNDYVMRCGDNAPPGQSRFGIESRGPDGKSGTDDDIQSWK